MTKLEQTALDEAFVAHFAVLFGNLCLGWSDSEDALQRFGRGFTNLQEAYESVQAILKKGE